MTIALTDTSSISNRPGFENTGAQKNSHISQAGSTAIQQVGKLALRPSALRCNSLTCSQAAKSFFRRFNSFNRINFDCGCAALRPCGIPFALLLCLVRLACLAGDPPQRPPITGVSHIALYVHG